ncbi:MAG TPA: SprT family zinc-dependent metalloprotease [Mycobacteriales bacterium]|nr:SprT family zinc-dependent metalloprotease [Mycobacteriales bacterium]
MRPAPTLPERVRIGDLDFTVRRSERRRTVGITVDRDGSLLLHAPAGADPDRVLAWVRAKRMWVHRRLADKDLLLAPRQDKEFVTGEGFDYLGRRYRLLLTDREPGTPVRLERGRLHLPRAAARAGGGPEAMVRWYRARGMAWLPRRIAPWAARMALYPGALDVRDLGYRWGSLGQGDRLNLHWAAMQLPVSLLDYLIVHELAHIAEPGHDPAFWAAVRRAMPDHDQRRRRLAATGATL